MVRSKFIAVVLIALSMTALAKEPSQAAKLVTQPLDVTYGEVQRPENWYYSWFTTEQGIVWTISREDASKGAYETGMRIQFVPAVSSQIGKSAEQVAREFVAQKESSSRVVKRCQVSPSGDFKRICLETLEPSSKPGENFHILYTVSWDEGRDWFVISTFGAPESEWEALRPTIDAMTKITLVGERFNRESEPNNSLQGRRP